MLAYARNEINRTRTTLSKTKPSSEQPRESARGSQPSRTPVTRGGAGERSAPRPFRRKPTLSSEQLRESARGSQPSRLPSPEGGCREAERPTPVSSETTPTKEQPASSETKISIRTAPGERERVATLSPPVPQRGCRGAERPTPASSETKSFKRIACFVGNQFLHQNSPWESSRGCEPSRLPIEAGDLRGGKVACPKGKQVASRPTKRNRRFRLVAPGADFFGGEPAPRRKNRFLADSAPGNPQDFSGI